jgi:hypothetical protein
MSRAAVVKFIGAVSIHFPRPSCPENPREAAEWKQRETMWLDSMIQILGGYDEDVLQRAATRIVRSETRDRRFPLPAVCRQVCEEIVKADKASQPPTIEDRAKDLKGNADWQYRLADDLIMCEMGRRAAREGWILSLHDFCRINGRLPTADWEIRKCIDGARGFDKAYEEVLNGAGGVCAKALEALGDTMLKRREALRARVLGKEAA